MVDPRLGHVVELLLDALGLVGLVELDGQAAGLEQVVGDARRQAPAGGVIGEAGGLQVGVGRFLGGVPASPQVELPGDWQADARRLHAQEVHRVERELLERSLLGRVQRGVVRLGDRGAEVALRVVGIKGRAAHLDGLGQLGEGVLGVGAVLQGLFDQAGQLGVVVERPPVVEGLGRSGRRGLGSLVGGGGMHVGLAHGARGASLQEGGHACDGNEPAQRAGVRKASTQGRHEITNDAIDDRLASGLAPRLR